MGTQTNIAEKIIKNKADYILAVKGNQEQLFEEVKDEFRFVKNIKTDINYGHGRIETRKCSVVSDFQFINNHDNKWNKLNQIINKENASEKATRYYISSLTNSAENYQKNIRSHWSVENKLHWTLDVAFSEDVSRKRNNNDA